MFPETVKPTPPTLNQISRTFYTSIRYPSSLLQTTRKLVTYTRSLYAYLWILRNVRAFWCRRISREYRIRRSGKFAETRSDVTNFYILAEREFNKHINEKNKHKKKKKPSLRYHRASIYLLVKKTGFACVLRREVLQRRGISMEFHRYTDETMGVNFLVLWRTCFQGYTRGGGLYEWNLASFYVLVEIINELINWRIEFVCNEKGEYFVSWIRDVERFELIEILIPLKHFPKIIIFFIFEFNSFLFNIFEYFCR